MNNARLQAEVARKEEEHTQQVPINPEPPIPNPKP